jgi:ATP-dependent helicase/nuclease subunit A
MPVNIFLREKELSVPELLEGLDEEQEKAVTLETNGVIAAGAGSGKTRVLASRYVWLVTEKNLRPEEILTLTFTNKAVSEMYSRIYRYLLAHSESGLAGAARARDAINDFHKARISTLDSFSANVARTAAAR